MLVMSAKVRFFFEIIAFFHGNLRKYINNDHTQLRDNALKGQKATSPGQRPVEN
jgi:hypothetical protein